MVSITDIPGMKEDSRLENIILGGIYVVLVMLVITVVSPSIGGLGLDDESDEPSGYSVKVMGEGAWTGRIYDDDVEGQRIEGEGTETYELDDGLFESIEGLFESDDDSRYITARAWKESMDSSELTIQLLKDGEVVREQSTTAKEGHVKVSSNRSTSSGRPTNYSVNVSYEGEWQVDLGRDHNSHTVEGNGTETFVIDGDPTYVSAEARKVDDGPGQLTVTILEDGEMLERRSTTARFITASVHDYDYQSVETNVRVESERNGRSAFHRPVAERPQPRGPMSR